MPLINSLTTSSNPFPAAQDITDRPYVLYLEFSSLLPMQHMQHPTKCHYRENIIAEQCTQTNRMPFASIFIRPDLDSPNTCLKEMD